MEKTEKTNFLDHEKSRKVKNVDRNLGDRLDLLIKVLTIVLVLLGIVALALFSYVLLVNYALKSTQENDNGNQKINELMENNRIVSSFSSSSNNADQFTTVTVTGNDNIVIIGTNRTTSTVQPLTNKEFLNSVTKSRRSSYYGTTSHFYRYGGSRAPFIENVQMFDEELGVSLSDFSLRADQTEKQPPPNSTDLNERRSFFLRQMARELWYSNQMQSSIANRFKIDLMSTLWVMNLTKEFDEGKRLMSSSSWDLHQLATDWEVFDVVTEWIGGLLSCYALTGDEVFLRNAKEIAKDMEPAYSSVSGLPYYTYNFNKKTPMGKWQPLAKIAGQLIEYKYLASVTRDEQVNLRIQSLMYHLRREDPTRSLFSTQNVNVQTSRDAYRMNTMFDQLQAANYDITAWKKLIFDDKSRINELINYNDYHNYRIHTSRYGGLQYANSKSGFMFYSNCYLGALLALANATTTDKDYFSLAVNLTETCFQASNRTQTGLPPERFDFDDTPNGDEATNSKKDHRRAFWLNPELAESYFVLWRLTHNEKYRTYAWALVRSIFEHTRSCRKRDYYKNDQNCQYYPIEDVNQIPTTKLNNKETQHYTGRFLSGTLKYLYLTFTDESVLPLDQWLFNYAGHPLPICGRNPVYPKDVTNCDLY